LLARIVNLPSHTLVSDGECSAYVQGEREEAAKNELQILILGRKNTTYNHPGTCNLYMVLFLVENIQVLLMQCPGSFLGIIGPNPRVFPSPTGFML